MMDPCGYTVPSCGSSGKYFQILESTSAHGFRKKMNKLENAPNFFIIGAAKAGTTTLYDLLDQHPQVYLPFDKEPAFFCDDDYFRNGIDWYLQTFFAGANVSPS